MGNGDGTFRNKVDYIRGGNGKSSCVQIGDLNGDGVQDLAVSNPNQGMVSVLMGNTDGTFQTKYDYPVGNYTTEDPADLDISDINLDGKQDIIICNCNDNTVSILLGNGNGTFQARRIFATGTQPLRCKVKDINNDGKPDIVTSNVDSGKICVLLNNGTYCADNTFTIGDFNSDGKPDIVITQSPTTSLKVLLHN